VSAGNVDFELDTICVPLHPVEAAISTESDANTLGVNLTVSQAFAHAAKHIFLEQYLADLVSKDEAEFEAIDEELDANPDTPVSGRMKIAFLLSPAPVIPTFLQSDGTISRPDFVTQCCRHCATSRVNFEQTRKPDINVEYLGGKFSLNHTAEGPTTERSYGRIFFQKARYRR
jgi:hypothetical protein